MGNKTILKLFYRLYQGSEYDSLPEVQEAEKISSDEFAKITQEVGSEMFLKIEDNIMDSCMAYEKSGFITGFKLAMKLMSESGIPKPKAVSV